MAKRASPPTSSTASSATPDVMTGSSGATLPHLEVAPPFLFVFNSRRWGVQCGKLIPSLHKIPLVAGVNQVEQTNDGKLKLANLRARLETEGRTVVPWDWAPDGSSYLQSIETRPGGSPHVVAKTWISVFETAEAGGEETNPDEDAYVDWVDGLVQKKRLPACSLPVAKKLLEDATKRLAKARADAAKLGGHGAPLIRAESILKEVEVLEAYVKKVTPERIRGTAGVPDLGDA